MKDLMNRLVRSYILKWDRELDQIKLNCPLVQTNELKIIAQSKVNNELYKNIKKCTSYGHLKSEFPVITYDDIKDKIHNFKNDPSTRCEYFAQSSGTTTGEKKLIPTSEYYVRRNHLRGSWYILNTLYKHNPKMSVFTSKNLLIGGSIYQKKRYGTIADVSGIMLNRIPSFFRPWYVPSIRTAVHPDWDYKIHETAKAAAMTKNIALLGGIPTWVLAVLRLVLEYSNKNELSKLWPNLRAYIHGGVSFDPYKEQFQQLIDIPDFRYIEVYNASEGFFAFQDRPNDEGMLLMCSSGIFYEFISLSDFRLGNLKCCSIEDVTLEEEYVMVITTASGLIRYIQGDIIKFVSLNPHRIKVTGRTKEFINAFGEDLMRHHVEEALLTVNKVFNVRIRDYTIAPHYISVKEKGWHDWYIEFERAPKDLTAYELALDKEIKTLNSNYDQKRKDSLALENLKIHVLPSGTVDQYFRRYSKIGGQSKLQKLCDNRKISTLIESLIGDQSLVI